MIGMKDQCFGVEVEMTGLTRGQAAQALANYFGTEPYYVGGGYDKWSVKDPDGKAWSIMSDSSIVTEMKTASGYIRTGDIEYRVEMVTPKLTYAELPKLQECVRQVRHAGAKVNNSCGIHVHVDAANHNSQSLKNLLSIMYSKEDILFKALQVNSSRVSQYCQKVREPMLKEARKLSSDETKNLTALESIWYEGNISDREHYMKEHDRLEAAYRRRTYYHKAHYSLDRGDGIEYDALFVSMTPCELYERKVTMEQLHAAIAALPDKQAKRIYAYYFLGLTESAIAKSEGVSVASVSESIQRGLRNMETFLKNRL